MTDWDTLTVSNKALSAMISKMGEKLGKNPRQIEKRLREIFQKTEECWAHVIESLKGKKVNYVLIGEAAPWSGDDEEVSYFYNRAMEGGSPFLNNVYKAFCGYEHKAANNTKAEMIDAISDRGFILIDMLPFALPYRNKSYGLGQTKQFKASYEQLVQGSMTYLFDKLDRIKGQMKDKRLVRVAYKLQCDPLRKGIDDGHWLFDVLDRGPVNEHPNPSRVPQPEHLKRGFGLK
jgi:hypothetical protein